MNELKDISRDLLTYNDYADWSQEKLYEHYWSEEDKSVYNHYPLSLEKEEGLNYWWKAHAADALIDGFERTKDQRYAVRAESIIDQVFERNGSLFNEFYDDEEWMALACLRLYDLTGSDKMKDYTIRLWEDIKTAWWDDEIGGLAWKKDDGRKNRNSCCNGPGAILAARLYQRFQDESDLEWAKKIYDYEKKYLVDPDSGLVYDGMVVLEDQSLNINKAWLFTYNAGTYIGAGAELYRITGDNSYLSDAEKTAIGSMEQLINEAGVLKSEGNGDGGLFKGILLRYLEQLYQVNQDEKIADFIKHNAKKLALYGSCIKQGLFGPLWQTKPETSLDVTCQTSGVFLFEAAAKIFGEETLV
jgi:predicted alpha-1,6-mannanase (GH76 family)